MRILLDQNDFEKLTRGEVIKKESVEIALSDIGFDIMIDIIENNFINSLVEDPNDSEAQAFLKDFSKKLFKQKQGYKNND